MSLTPTELLQALHWAVTATLIRKLREPRPAAMILVVARMFLRDNAVEPRNDEAAAKALRRIQRLYVERLVEGLSDGKPPLALLTEARVYAESVRITPGDEPAEPLSGPAMGLPFN
jgi:hypothetical protein